MQRLVVLLMFFVPALRVSAEPLWFVLSPVDGSNVSDVALDNPRVAGYSIRVSWNEIEPQDEQYDWSHLDAEIARATARGKQYMIRVIAGDATPTHAYSQPWVEGIPQPDDPQMSIAYHDLQQALAARYGSETSLYGVHACGFDVCEWHLPDSQTKTWWDKQFDFRLAFQQRIGSVRAAFDDRVLVIANHSPQPYSDDLLSWMESQPGIAAQMNALKADTSTSWDGFLAIRDYATTSGWQFVGPSIDANGQPLPRFGGSFDQAVQLGLESQPAYFEFYQWDVELLNGWSRCDWNGDGACTVDELDALMLQAIADTNGHVTDRSLDLNQDGVISVDDRDIWLNASGHMPGDANLDGYVDGVDFIAWNGGSFEPSDEKQPWQRGEWNGDGVVDGLDFAIWNSYHGLQRSPVPEPGFSLSLLAAVILLQMRSGRSA